MKRTTLILAIALLAAGCGNSEDHETEYINAVTVTSPELMQTVEAQDAAVKVGKSICNLLDEGLGTEISYSIGIEHGRTRQQMDSMVNAATANFCPAYRNDL